MRYHVILSLLPFSLCSAIWTSCFFSPSHCNHCFFFSVFFSTREKDLAGGCFNFHKQNAIKEEISVVEHKQTSQANQRPAVFFLLLFSLSWNVNGMVIVLHSLSGCHGRCGDSLELKMHLVRLLIKTLRQCRWLPPFPVV